MKKEETREIEKEEIYRNRQRGRERRRDRERG